MDGLAEDDDARLVVDINLAILGSDPGRYAEFERDVRNEYKWVPGLVYRKGRAKILQSFLARPRIYLWPAAYEDFEHRARINVGQVIQTLTGDP